MLRPGRKRLADQSVCNGNALLSLPIQVQHTYPPTSSCNKLTPLDGRWWHSCYQRKTGLMHNIQPVEELSQRISILVMISGLQIQDEQDALEAQSLNQPDQFCDLSLNIQRIVFIWEQVSKWDRLKYGPHVFVKTIREATISSPSPPRLFNQPTQILALHARQISGMFLILKQKVLQFQTGRDHHLCQMTVCLT